MNLCDLPESYLKWLADRPDLRDPLWSAVLEELQGREQDYEPPRRGSNTEPTVLIRSEHIPLAIELVNAGHRQLARRHHPDIGGNITAMQDLNALADSLRTQLGGLEARR